MFRMIGTAALATLTATGGHAASFYDDLGLFLAAAGPTSVEGFESRTVYTTEVTQSFPDFDMTESGGTNIIGVGPGFPDFAVVNGAIAAAYDDNGSSVLTFDGFAGPLTAFGTWVTSTGGGTMTVGGSVSTSFVLTGGQAAFFGVVGSGITSVSFDMEGGPNVGFDDVYTGGSAVVPVPAALPLAATGLAGLALLRRRRKAG